MNAFKTGLLLLLLAGAAPAAETVQLLSGAILVGDVELRDGGQTVAVRTRFPKDEQTFLDASEVAPASLYWIHERRSDRTDPEDRLRLAELASDAGLDGVAITEYLALKALDPSRSREVDERVAELTERVAQETLGSAEELLDQGKPRSALLSLHAIEELYPQTRAAADAHKLMKQAHERVGDAAPVAKNTVSLRRAPGVLDDIDSALERGDREREKAGGHIGTTTGSSEQRRALDRALRFYSKAWEAAKTLPVSAQDPELKDRVETARRVARQKLVAVYLDAASLQLQRQSITKAEEYCNAACELDPENKNLHLTHRLILEAKAFGF